MTDYLCARKDSAIKVLRKATREGSCNVISSTITWRLPVVLHVPSTVHPVRNATSQIPPQTC